jgi:hypothetical protein
MSLASHEVLVPHHAPGGTIRPRCVSLLLCNPSQISIRASLCDDAPHRIKQQMAMQKRMISIVWTVNEIHNVLHCPKGITENTRQPRSRLSKECMRVSSSVLDICKEKCLIPIADRGEPVQHEYEDHRRNDHAMLTGIFKS